MPIMQVNRKDMQTLLDLALEYTGSLDACMAIAMSNGVALTDLPANVNIMQDIVTPSVVEHYKQNYAPATGGSYIEPTEDGAGDSIHINIKTTPPTKQVTVKDQQNLLDVAIELYGGIEAAFDLALLNSINVTDDVVGMLLSDRAKTVDPSVVKTYQRNQIKPATAYIDNIEGGTMEGIGYWAIEMDFVVS